MAQLTATITTSCDSATGKGVVHFSQVSDPNSQGGDTYSWLVNRNGNPVASGPIALGETVDYDPLDDDNYSFLVSNDLTGERSEPVVVALNCGGTNPPAGGTTPTPNPSPTPTPTPSGPTGCTTRRALNYNPSATQDSQPTACVFVQVAQAPDLQLVAAHLPIPVVVRASPTESGLAMFVVLTLETAPTPTTPDASWITFGRLRQVCDATAAASFNLSEAAKSLLVIQPPVESGTDASLSVLVRARYQVLDPETMGVLYAGIACTFRALNAVLASVAGAAMATPTPYASLPTGGRAWGTSATYAGGVVAAPLTLPANACLARQFVWLNAAGAWDAGFFFGRHEHGTSQDSGTIYREASGAAHYSSRGVVQPTLLVYSDVTDFATYSLLRGLRQSVQVYERLGPSQYVPVLLSAESFPEYKEGTDKIFQVNFTVSYPAQLIQTQ